MIQEIEIKTHAIDHCFKITNNYETNIEITAQTGYLISV